MLKGTAFGNTFPSSDNFELWQVELVLQLIVSSETVVLFCLILLLYPNTPRSDFWWVTPSVETYGMSGSVGSSLILSHIVLLYC